MPKHLRRKTDFRSFSAFFSLDFHRTPRVCLRMRVYILAWVTECVCVCGSRAILFREWSTRFLLSCVIFSSSSRSSSFSIGCRGTTLMRVELFYARAVIKDSIHRNTWKLVARRRDRKRGEEEDTAAAEKLLWNRFDTLSTFARSRWF